MSSSIQGTLAAASDNLGGTYAAASRDKSKTSKEREAAMLYLVAEHHLNDEEDESALKVSQDALAIFRQQGDLEGVADAIRIAVHVLIYQDQRQDADRMARDELARIRKGDDRRGEGKMLLSIADVNCEHRGAQALEDALLCATEAQALFRDQGDKRMEANAMLTLLNINLRRKGDKQKDASAALALAQLARALFKELGDTRGEALALHGAALAAVTARDANLEIESLPSGWEGAMREAARLIAERELAKLEAFLRTCTAQWLIAENPRRAVKLAEEALAACRDSKCRYEPAALGILVQAHLAITDMSKAWVHKEAAKAAKIAKSGLARFRAAGNGFGEGQALAALVLAHLAQDDVPEALKAAEAAAKCFRRLGAIGSESMMLQMAASLHLRKADADKALQSARGIAATAQTLQGKVAGLETLYEVYLQKRDFTKARECVDDILALCEEDGDKKKAAVATLLVSNLHFVRGNSVEAVTSAREAQAILHDLGCAKEEAHALRVVAEVQASTQDYQAALRAAERAMRILQGGAVDKVAEAAVMFLVAQLRLLQLAAKGDMAPSRPSASFIDGIAEAAKAAQESVVLAKKIGNTSLAGAALCVVAQVQMANLQLEAATRATDEAMAIFRELADERNIASVMVIQADIHLVGGNTSKALNLIGKAIKIFQAQGDKRGEWVAMGVKEHIQGPEEEAQPLADQWSEAEWQMWEAHQQQQLQGQQQQQAAPAMPQALEKQRQKRTKAELGTLDMRNLTPDLVTQRVVEIVRVTIDLDDNEDVEDDMPLMQIGVTSKTAVELRNSLAEDFPGVNFPFTMVFDYPSVGSMTDMIMDGLPG